MHKRCAILHLTYFDVKALIFMAVQFFLRFVFVTTILKWLLKLDLWVVILIYMLKGLFYHFKLES
ncbi:hypothetical protein XM47_17355 [Catenovulum maritimum]|uniref:Uncharacterized protein n=1 Tax=Catenovulum maritimum TaxID=1513271 RepID=A0A0J8GMA8_9ALTE|nr:hypothetical protein XM47_17355 [Catenovulum maritimum]